MGGPGAGSGPRHGPAEVSLIASLPGAGKTRQARAWDASPQRLDAAQAFEDALAAEAWRSRRLRRK